MKSEMSPALTAVIVGIAVVALLFWGYKAMQPAPYVPSPGAAGTPMPGGTPGQPVQANARNPMPPAGAVPGQPPAAATR